jgi:acyl carrier protein
MSPARALLADMVGDRDFVGSLSDTHLLAHSGVNSGDLVRLMLALEERLDRPLTLEEVHRLVTIADIDALLVAHGTTVVADPGPPASSR